MSFSSTPPMASVFDDVSARFALSALPAVLACLTERPGASALTWFFEMFLTCFFSFLFRMLLIAVGAAMAVPANATTRAANATIIAGDGRLPSNSSSMTPLFRWVGSSARTTHPVSFGIAPRCWAPYPCRLPRARGSSGVAHPLQDRDLADLRWLQVVPENPARPGVLAFDLDHRPRCGDQVHRQVVRRGLQVLPQDLNRVNGRSDRGVVVDLARLDQQAVLQVRETAALADTPSAQVDGDRAAEHEVDLGEVFIGHHPAVAQGPLDRGCLAQLLRRQLAGLQQAERVDVA